MKITKFSIFSERGDSMLTNPYRIIANNVAIDIEEHDTIEVMEARIKFISDIVRGNDEITIFSKSASTDEFIANVFNVPIDRILITFTGD
jgi:hypothetical protein